MTYENLVALFHKVYGEDDVSIERKEDMITITVRLEDFTIKNERNQTHLIQEPWCLFTFELREDRIKYWYPQFYRTKYTYNEVSKGYMHSHIQAFNGYFVPSDMCYGSDDDSYGAYQEGFLNSYIDDSFEYYLATYQHFLKTESLAGAPHIKMEVVSGLEIKLGSMSISETDLADMCTNRFVSDLQFDNNARLLDNETNNNLLITILEPIYPECIFYEIEGRLYTDQRFHNTSAPESFDDSHVIMFKGHAHSVTFVEDEYKDLTNFKRKVHSNVFKSISDYFCARIKTKILEKQFPGSSVTRKVKSHYIKKAQKQDQAVMLCC